MTSNILVNLPRRASGALTNYVQRRQMPVNVPPTATGKRRFRLAVETDPHKLVNYCCGLNYHNDEPSIKLKPDEEYPDWLWKLRLEPKPKSWEMEPGTKEYYLQLKEEENAQNELQRLRAAKPKKVVGKVLKTNQEYLHHLRFAALAHMEPDAGFEQTSMETDWWATNNQGKIQMSDYYLPVNENRVLYMDKIEGNIKRKNFHYDWTSSFRKLDELRLNRRPRNKSEAFQDSKRRHRYAGT